jgi:hypothetical protein
VNLSFEYQTLRINEQQVALATSDFLCTPSYPRCCSPPTPVVLADWKSTMPDTRMSLPSRSRKRSRSAAFTSPTPRRYAASQNQQ